MQDGEPQPAANDQLVVDSIARGDLLAFESVYRAHKDRLLTVLVMAFGLDRSAAEDILHDVFTRLAEQASSVRLSGSLRGYLAACCRNRATDVARRDHQRRACIEAQARSSSGPADPGAIAETSEAIERVSQLLDHLPDGQREVVSLHLHGELTFREIADALHIPVNTAKSRYRYALDRLRELWKSPPEGAGETHVRSIRNRTTRW
jgi:RNA polymerase sigma-70 factor (ECF subfamily)